MADERRSDADEADCSGPDAVFFGRKIREGNIGVPDGAAAGCPGGLFVAYMMLLTIETAVHLLKPGYETASSTTDVDTPGDSGGVIEIMGRTKE